MSAVDLCWLDAHDQARLVREGELSAAELLASTVARVERLEPTLNALGATSFDAALGRAERGVSGPFAGVPLVYKDVIRYPGLRFSLGSRAFASQVAREGSPYTDVLDAAGFLPLGKSTTSELGLLASTESLLDGPTRNPWDLSRSALGSSGGSAVAVASGMVPLAHGADGGGSLRLPASATGVFAFKPSARTQHQTGPSLGLMDDLVSHHCLTRSVRDSARVFALTESETSPFPTVGFVAHTSGRRLRIGYYRDDADGTPPAPEVALALSEALGVCDALGHELVEVPSPPVVPYDVAQVFFVVAGAVVDQTALSLEVTLGRRPGRAELEPHTLSLLRWVRRQPPDIREQVTLARERVVRAMERMFAAVDVLACPTTPVLPPALGTLSPERTFDEALAIGGRIAAYTAVHNVIGAPAMSVPLHVTAGGLPVGTMFAAAPGGDRTLFELAYQLEEAAPWAGRRPPSPPG